MKGNRPAHLAGMRNNGGEVALQFPEVFERLLKYRHNAH